MTVRTQYIAEDGMIFYSEKACLDYENSDSYKRRKEEKQKQMEKETEQAMKIIEKIFS